MHVASTFLLSSEHRQARRFDPIGGVQVQPARLTEHLRSRGVEQTVITAYRPRARQLEDNRAELRIMRLVFRLHLAGSSTQDRRSLQQSVLRATLMWSTFTPVLI